jgi:pimeloyl-ACP methyl ester carboxylesterase
MSASQIVVSGALSLLGLVVVSYVVEALRRAPTEPGELAWARGIPILHADVDGLRIRYIRAGQGPVLVLLHTLRTQLDIFQKVIPELSKRFTVYAPDYPGHGYSDIPEARYDADFFVKTVERFLDGLDLRDATLAGVSIGGSIALLIAARRNPRIVRVIAINPYDYARGRGLARSSWLGWIVTHAARIPVVGETIMRLRIFAIMKAVFRGGVADPASIPQELLEEMYRVGDRRGHYRAFISLMRNAASWEAATRDYNRIEVPVRLVWGEEDWATPAERELDRKLIPRAETITIERAGHFLPLDRPEAVINAIQEFHARAP